MFRFVLTLLVVLLAVQTFAKSHDQKQKSEKKTDDCIQCGKVFTKAFDTYVNLTYTAQLEKLRSACESSSIRNREALSNMCTGLVAKIEETKEELTDSKNHKAACKKLGACPVTQNNNKSEESSSSSESQPETETSITESKHKHHHDKDKSKHHDKDESKHHDKDESKHHDKDESKHHDKDESKHHDKDEKHHNKDKHGHHEHKHGHHDDKHKHGDHKNKHGHHNKHGNHHHEDDDTKHTNCSRHERFTCFRSCEDVDRLMLNSCHKVSVRSVCQEETAEWMCPTQVHGHNISYVPELMCPVPDSCDGPRKLGKVCVGSQWFDRDLLSSYVTPENIRYFLVFSFVSFFVLVLAIFYRCVVCYSAKEDEKSEKGKKYKAVAESEYETEKL